MGELFGLLGMCLVGYIKSEVFVLCVKMKIITRLWRLLLA